MAGLKGDNLPTKEEKVEKPEEVEELETTEEESEESEGSDESEEDEISGDELKEAKTLYRALKNPATAENVVAALARQAGFEKPENKKEQAEQKRTIKTIIREKLGDEYKFLADKLEGVFEEAFAIEREETAKQTKAAESRAVEVQVSNALDRLARETKGESRKLEGQMEKLMVKILPGQGVSVYDYLRDIYTVASASGKEKTVRSQMADKIKRNGSDVASRLRTAGTPESKIPNKKMNLNEAVQWAASQLEKS